MRMQIVIPALLAAGAWSISLPGMAATAPAADSFQVSASPSLNSRDTLDLPTANNVLPAESAGNRATGATLLGVQPMGEGPVTSVIQPTQAHGVTSWGTDPGVPGGPPGGDDAPEPSTAMLLGLGVVLAGASYRRRRTGSST